MTSSARCWDIFCKVVDNFGDIGVCWRLARQLVAEHGIPVRLWVDDLESFARLHAGIEPAEEAQVRRGVEVRRWREPWPSVEPGEVVIETFGCDVPETFLRAMAARVPKPAWINLEYLSAEAWVAGCHGLPSPHPRLPLTRHFFFPGFTPETGGLICEGGLSGRRQSFEADAAGKAALWRSLGSPPPGPGTFTVLLFAYENPGLAELLAAWAGGGEDLLVLMPEGRAAEQAKAWFQPQDALGGGRFQQGRLTLQELPFVDQERFDELLWVADLNFVRGEDSFVRAQWAAKPFVWHIYPQRENAHWVKLNAFIDLFTRGLEARATAALRDFWRAWVSGRGAGAAWPAFRAAHPSLLRHAALWAEAQAAAPDLGSNLIRFAAGVLHFSVVQ